MSEIKYTRRFAEIERVLDDYFDQHLAPVMRDTENFIKNRQMEETAGYSKSVAGILSVMATAQNPAVDPYRTLKQTGEWNSKTTEDYLAMCRERIAGDRYLQKDLALMAGEWRNTVVAEIGTKRYNELSSNLGGDLAYSFIEYRVGQLMIDKIVKDRMPKSSAEYIMRKAAQNTLLGIDSTLTQSPLAAEIERQGYEAYRPSKLEKGAGWAIGAGIDALSFGGAGSWASLARFVGIDLAFNTIASAAEGKDNKFSVEDCISKGVFGSDANVFDEFRRQAAGIRRDSDTYIVATNNRLSNKIDIQTLDFSDWTAKNTSLNMPSGYEENPLNRAGKYKDVPMVIAPGQEDAYLRDMEGKQTEYNGQQPDVLDVSKEREPAVVDSAPDKVLVSALDQPQDERTAQTKEEMSPQKTNGNGWNGLLSSLGLGGFGPVGRNLGYVFAMLPDILVGLFTGRTQSLKLGDNLLPIASVIAGIFTKNPILKMLMIGMGGANLLNKVGHEVLDWKRGEALAGNTGTARYRVYQDEPLNARISEPILRGGCLVATIDGVPCTIQLSGKVVSAYNAGALPLNTLANAVLAKCDQTRQIMAASYENSDRETVTKTRGIQ